MKRFLQLLATLMVWVWLAPAFAEESATTVVLLDVPGGGTDLLKSKIAEIEGVTLKDQKWFLGEISSRGISPKRILRRTKDLQWVIKGANINVIVYLAKNDADDTKYDVSIVDESGTNVAEFNVDVTETGLGDSGAKIVVTELRKVLKKPETTVVLVEDPADEAPTTTRDDEGEELLDPATQRERARAEEERLKARLTKDWLVATVSGRVFSRELMVTSANGTQLSYSSAPYPGFELRAEAYPGAFADPRYADIGLMLRLAMGFGSVESTQTDSMLHMDAEIGPLFRLVSPLGQDGGATSVRAQAKFTVRYTSFSVDSQALPETSMIAPTIGASVSYPVFVPGLVVTGYFDVVPFGIWGANREGFGESAYTFSFSSGLGLLYAIDRNFGITGGFDVRLERTTFSGRGTYDFEDARALEFLQAVNIGALLTL